MFDDKDFEECRPDKEEISTTEMDQALMLTKQLEAEYKAAKKVSSEKYARAEEAKAKLISMMEKSGKSRWEVEGFGGFTKYNELKFRVPKDLSDKEAFFSFLKSDTVCEMMKSNPKDIFLAYVSVNSQTLNKLCKELTDKAHEKGEDLPIPGIAAPKAEPKLRSLAKK